MSALVTKRIIRLLIPAGIVVVFFSGFFGFKLYSQKTQVWLYVFDNCGGCSTEYPCRPCTVLISEINKCMQILTEHNLRDKTELKSYNTYMDNDAEMYRKNMAAMGLEEAPSLPVIVVGGTIISGADRSVQMITAVKAERRFIPLLRQFFGFRETQNVTMGHYDEKTIVMFTIPLCEDCIRTGTYLESLAGITVIKIGPSDAAGRALYERYCQVYGVPVNDYAVPRLFIQRSSFLGYNETERYLENVLIGNFKTIKIEWAINDR